MSKWVLWLSAYPALRLPFFLERFERCCCVSEACISKVGLMRESHSRPDFESRSVKRDCTMTAAQIIVQAALCKRTPRARPTCMRAIAPLCITTDGMNIWFISLRIMLYHRMRRAHLSNNGLLGRSCDERTLSLRSPAMWQSPSPRPAANASWA